MIIRLALVDDIEAILQLQEKYHVSNLTEAEKQQKGFVTMRITPEQLTQLIDDACVFIATSDDDLAAYTLTGTWDFDRQWAIIQRMELFLPTLNLENATITVENSIQYGPVCIDEAYRGHDILTLLFDAVENHYRSKYAYIVTFINQINERSLRAHAKKTPLSIIGTFDFNDNQYYALASKIGNH